MGKDGKVVALDHFIWVPSGNTANTALLLHNKLHSQNWRGLKKNQEIKFKWLWKLIKRKEFLIDLTLHWPACPNSLMSNHSIHWFTCIGAVLGKSWSFSGFSKYLLPHSYNPGAFIYKRIKVHRKLICQTSISAVVQAFASKAESQEARIKI